MNKITTILILGGYGQAGSLFCWYLLRETPVHIIIAGRHLDKADALAERLRKDFSATRIFTRYVEASDRKSLQNAFCDIDLVLVAATTTQWAKQIAEVALSASVDYLDIYFQQDIYPILETLKPRIAQAKRCFITQAGFHPGLPSVYIRKGAPYFDQYNKAIIAFTMNMKLLASESVDEFIDALADYKPEFYQDGTWKVGTYKDTIKIDYGHRFGVRDSVPFSLIEVKTLPKSLNLQEIGVYTTGFNWFTDYLLFPLIMLSQKIKKGLFRRFWAKLFIFGINQFSSTKEGVVFLLEAEGKKDGHAQKIKILTEHDSVYDFTVIPVIACLKQYLEGSARQTGLWMMGHLVDPDRLFDDMEKMKLKIQIVIINKEIIT